MYRSVYAKILLICDQYAIAQMVAMLLRTKGYGLQTVGSSKEALKVIHNDTDLILVDLVSSDEDVYQCCYDIKVNIQTQHIPIIVLTSSDDPLQKMQLLELRVDDYIHKPIEPDELFQRISHVCRKHFSASAIDHQRQVQTFKEIQYILNERKITPFFQPIYYLKPRRLLGVEMLSRPQTDTFLYKPEAFFTETLRLGLYMDAQLLAWHQAFESSRRMLCQGSYQIFLNCNPYMLESDQFFNVKRFIEQYDIPSDRICLEITEYSPLQEEALFTDRLQQYRHEGFKIAMDHVGPGQQALESIAQMKPHVVKIDRSIIAGLRQDPIKRSIVSLLLTFCQDRKIMCVAEGIENEQDLGLVIEMGIDAGQGYYLGKPNENLSECLV